MEKRIISIMEPPLWYSLIKKGAMLIMVDMKIMDYTCTTAAKLAVFS
jgi:hypothetical protein